MIPRQYSYNWFAGYKGSGKTTWEPFIPGDFTFVSDQKNWTGNFASGLYHDVLHLPPDFPRRVYINRVRITMDGDRTAGATGEIQVWVDPGGIYFDTALPKGSQTGPADMSRIVTMRHLYFVGAPVDDVTDLAHPVTLDRDANDLLSVEVSPGQEYSWLNVEFDYQLDLPAVSGSSPGFIVRHPPESS
jgi:hypothetical protein